MAKKVPTNTNNLRAGKQHTKTSIGNSTNSHNTSKNAKAGKGAKKYRGQGR